MAPSLFTTSIHTLLPWGQVTRAGSWWASLGDADMRRALSDADYEVRDAPAGIPHFLSRRVPPPVLPSPPVLPTVFRMVFPDRMSPPVFHTGTPHR